MPGNATVHECVGCPHLASSHRLVKGAPIEGPYRCLHCGHEMQRDDRTRLITVAEMWRLHGDEVQANTLLAPATVTF